MCCDHIVQEMNLQTVTLERPTKPATSPAARTGRRSTTYNVEVQRDSNGNWTLIDEINSRFSEGVDELELLRVGSVRR